MLSPILVPLDGSAFAELALPFAARLAAAHDALLHLVRAVDAASGADHPRRLEALDYLTRQAADATASCGCRVTTALAGEGDSAAAAITAEAARVRARLLVLTTHGRGGFSRLWLGSVATSLLGSSTIPMLVVRAPEDAPPPPPPAEPRHLLVAVDGSAASEAALATALALGAPFRARCTLLQVVQTGDSLLPYDQTFWTPAEQAQVEAQRAAAEDRMVAAVERVRGQGVAAEGVVVLAPDPARVILQTAAEQGADLVALGAHARAGAARLLPGVGGVTDKVLRAATIPVLVVRPGPAA
jgi:nucleotide-binding universal stress UspA family protein